MTRARIVAGLAVLACLASLPLSAEDCSEKLLQPDVVAGRKDLWYKAHVATLFTKEQFEAKNRDLMVLGSSFAFDYGDAQESKSRVESKLERSIEFAESTAFFKMQGNVAGFNAYVECKRLSPDTNSLDLRVTGQPEDTDYLITIFWKPAITAPGRLKNIRAQVTGGTLQSAPPTQMNAGHRTFVVSRPKADAVLKISVDGTKELGDFSDQLLIPPYIQIPEDEFRPPVFVNHRMIFGCKTRSDDRCSWEGASVVLGGQLHTNGVVFTQTWGQNNTALASFNIPKGAGKFIYTVGNYWLGGDCGGQQPMRAVIYIDGVPKWAGNVHTVHSGALDISANAKVIQLRGESIDQDVRCDDMAWGSLRFEK